ncbi:MAG: NTP transferase domain-containing protein, partial [Candidatus Nealsonbacteria bacterium]|nr:NTP transferase domain-containing protein [Candidatus Nealsonbacteria bacterium]
MQAVILAAGQSSRFWPLNQKHKSLIRVMGRSLISYTIDGLRKSGIMDIVVVQGASRDIEKELRDKKIKYITQSKPLGMGDALWQAKKLIKGPFLVLNAERVDIADILEIIPNSDPLNFRSSLIGQKTKTPELFGMMRMSGERVLEIIEKPKEKPPSDIRVVGVYFLEPGFFKIYQKVKKHQYDFEDALSLYIKESRVRVRMLKKTEEETPFLKYPWHLFSIVKYLFDNNLKKNEVRKGENVKIFKGAVINGPCYIGDNCIVGNNAVVRDYTDLEEGAMVGALAEVARSIFQKNSHCHSGYFGDSILGENCRAGAGTITANVRLDRRNIKNTGLNSMGVIVGENTHIGINSSLMPGVLIGSNCVIGPSSVIFDNLEDGSIFYSKFDNHIRRATHIPYTFSDKLKAYEKISNIQSAAKVVDR